MSSQQELAPGKRSFLSDAQRGALGTASGLFSARRQLESSKQTPSSRRRAIGLIAAGTVGATAALLGVRIWDSQAQTQTPEAISPPPLNLQGIVDAVTSQTIKKNPESKQAQIAIKVDGFSNVTVYISPNPDHQLPRVEAQLWSVGPKPMFAWNSLTGLRLIPVGEQGTILVSRLNLKGDGGWALAKGNSRINRQEVDLYVVGNKLYAIYKDGQNTSRKSPTEPFLVSDLPQVKPGDDNTISILSAIKLAPDGTVSVCGPDGVLKSFFTLNENFFTPGKNRGVYPEIFGSINSRETNADLLLSLEL